MTRAEHSSGIDRREFLRTVAIGATASAPLLGLACRPRAGVGSQAIAPASTGVDPWARVPSILARIQPPTFPAREFDITRYGAIGDGTSICTAAFRDAVAACASAGGGHVVVPRGRFLTGAIHLESNVDLHVTRGATVAFSRDPKAYLPQVLTRFEGTELMNYSPFIYALEKENIAVSGEGTLDGQASNDFWWGWKGSKEFGWKPGDPNYDAARRRLLAMAEQGVPVAQRAFGEGDYLRPNFIQPYRCRNVLIEGVTIVNSPMWEIHPVLCTNVIVRRVTIDSLGPNNDGCDPESCRDVLIESCIFNTGDDCIAIKSGRNADGRRLHVPSEDIVVRNCEMRDGHGGVTIGSEISGDCRYVFAENCRMNSPRLDRALRLKNNASRGGVLEHIYMRDVTVGHVSQAVLDIDFYYEEGPKGNYRPVARDVEMRHVTSESSKYALYIRGYDNAEISDIRVIDCTFDRVANPNVVEHATGVVLHDVHINGAPVGA
jgi:polygalacturonase